MSQIVARLDDSLVDQIDALVDGGFVRSRSDAVRIALERLVDLHRREQLGQQIVAAYRRQPQTPGELAGLEQATRALVGEEPW